MKIISLKCPSCDASILVSENVDSVICEYCDTKIHLKNGEIIINNSDNEVYFQSPNNEQQHKTIRMADEHDAYNQDNQIKEVTKSKQIWIVVAIILGFIILLTLLIVVFSSGKDTGNTDIYVAETTITNESETTNTTYAEETEYSEESEIPREVADNEELQSILEEISECFSLTTEFLSTEATNACDEAKNSIDDYSKYKQPAENWFALAQSETENMFARVKGKSIEYFRLTASIFDYNDYNALSRTLGYYYNYVGDFIDEYNDNIFDLFDKVYDEYGDTIIDIFGWDYYDDWSDTYWNTYDNWSAIYWEAYDDWSSTYWEVSWDINYVNEIDYDYTIGEATAIDTDVANEIAVPSSASKYKNENYNDVVNSLKDIGFSNIITEPIYDIFFGITPVGATASVSINGKTDFNSGDTFSKDAEVVVTYHLKFEDDPAKVAEKETEEEQKNLNSSLEKTFPQEYAMRAAVVFITNGYALDVFTDDGNYYDTEKFHRYSDKSGDLDSYYFTVNSKGTWTAQNDNTWHVEDMRLNKNYYGKINTARVELDVTYDGTNYIISNVKGTFGNNNLSDLEYTEELLTIPPKLILADR